MKKLITVIILNLIIIVSFAQTGEKEISTIRIGFRYKVSLAKLPEYYEIKIKENTVDYIQPRTKIPFEEEKKETIIFEKDKWEKLIFIIEKIRSDSLKSSTSKENNEDWYTLDFKYSNEKIVDKYKIWSKDAPKSLIELHELLKKK